MAYGESGSAVGEHCGESAREAFRDNRAGTTAREWIFGEGDGGNRREIAGKNHREKCQRGHREKHPESLSENRPEKLPEKPRK